jgi:hypothetical protein
MFRAFSQRLPKNQRGKLQLLCQHQKSLVFGLQRKLRRQSGEEKELKNSQFSFRGFGREREFIMALLLAFFSNQPISATFCSLDFNLEAPQTFHSKSPPLRRLSCVHLSLGIKFFRLCFNAEEFFFVFLKISSISSHFSVKSFLFSTLNSA